LKLSFTLEGGLGDFILKYLGSPGNRISSLLRVAEISLRMDSRQKAGQQLVQGNPFFDQSSLFTAKHGFKNHLSNDITLIRNIESYHKLTIPLWLDDEEERIFHNLKRPYGVLHPRASHPARCLSNIFDIYALSQWIADYSGAPLLVLGTEDFRYESSNVIDMTGIGSPRLACKIIEHASFFVGTHSSLQCAASVYNVPSVCIGPSHLLFHDFSCPFSFDVYLKPMFLNGSIFMMFNEAPHFMRFFEHFVETATSLSPNKDPELFRRKLVLSNMVYGKIAALSDIKIVENMDHNPNFQCLDVSGLR